MSTVLHLQLARSKKLFFMEAVWSRFFPAYEYVREQLASGAIGDIVQVNANMTIHFPEGSRVRYDGRRVRRHVYVVQAYADVEIHGAFSGVGQRRRAAGPSWTSACTCCSWC